MRALEQFAVLRGVRQRRRAQCRARDARRQADPEVAGRRASCLHRIHQTNTRQRRGALMTTSFSDCFAQTYAEARDLFLRSAADAGLTVQSHPHPRRGRDGEALAMDVARLGPPDAEALLVLSSACHGVEGFCGSGAQVALLRDERFRAAALRAGSAVLFIHALNPYGFSWWRRTTHENVDMNRNFHDFSRPLPASPEYDEIAQWIVPDTWPPNAEVQAHTLRYIAQH